MFKRSSISFILGLFFNFAAQAYADPQIVNFYQKNAPTVRVRALILFKNTIEASSFRLMSVSPKTARQALLQNASQAQARVTAMLRPKGIVATPESQSVRRYWLSNTIAADLNLSQIKEISVLPEVEAVVMSRSFHNVTQTKVNIVRPTKGLKPVYSPALTRIGADKVARRFSLLEGRGVRMGILDTGIDGQHPDLEGKTIVFRDFINGRKVAYDDNGHGTHVAGLIAGSNKSGIQLGVAPGVKLIIAKVFDEKSHAPDEIVLAGLEWITDPDGNPATDDQPHIVNNSWSSDVPSNSPNDPMALRMCQVIDNWVSLNILPVFSAGNKGPGPQTIGFPASCPNTLTVGATDFEDKSVYFSSQGPAHTLAGLILKPDVTAPGLYVLSTMPNSLYGLMSGTSMATPIVSGIAAVLKQANPNLPVMEIKSLIMKSSADKGPRGPDPQFGFGRVDVARAMGIK